MSNDIGFEKLGQQISHAVTVNTVEPIGGESRFVLQAAHGQLSASYEPGLGMFFLDRVDVEPDFRRCGIAKALVSAARQLAEESGAKEIFAHMSSRESIDVMSGVFGEQFVHIMTPGTYAPESNPKHHDASAVLLYAIGQSR